MRLTFILFYGCLPPINTKCADTTALFSWVTCTGLRTQIRGKTTTVKSASAERTISWPGNFKFSQTAILLGVHCPCIALSIVRVNNESWAVKAEPWKLSLVRLASGYANFSLCRQVYLEFSHIWLKRLLQALDQCRRVTGHLLLLSHTVQLLCVVSVASCSPRGACLCLRNVVHFSNSI